MSFSLDIGDRLVTHSNTFTKAGGTDSNASLKSNLIVKHGFPGLRNLHATGSQKILQLKLNTHNPLLFIWTQAGSGKRTASNSTLFYWLQIHVTCSVVEKPYLKGSGWSPDPAKRAFANPSPAGQASGRLWLQHLNNAIVLTDTARQKHTHPCEVDQNPQQFDFVTLPTLLHRHKQQRQHLSCVCK